MSEQAKKSSGIYFKGVKPRGRYSPGLPYSWAKAPTGTTGRTSQMWPTFASGKKKILKDTTVKGICYN